MDGKVLVPFWCEFYASMTLKTYPLLFFSYLFVVKVRELKLILLINNVNFFNIIT